jgi:hypothetical protein
VAPEEYQKYTKEELELTKNTVSKWLLEQVKHGFYWPCLFGNISMHRITSGPTAQ